MHKVPAATLELFGRVQVAVKLNLTSLLQGSSQLLEPTFSVSYLALHLHQHCSTFLSTVTRWPRYCTTAVQPHLDTANIIPLHLKSQWSCRVHKATFIAHSISTATLRCRTQKNIDLDSSDEKEYLIMQLITGWLVPNVSKSCITVPVPMAIEVGHLWQPWFKQLFSMASDGSLICPSDTGRFRILVSGLVWRQNLWPGDTKVACSIYIYTPDGSRLDRDQFALMIPGCHAVECIACW